MADTIAKVVVLDRTVYNNMISSGTINNQAIYFVRESSPESSRMLSLYVGQAKQCDLLDISGDTDVEFDPASDTYTIPDSYKVSDKLLFFEQDIVTDMEDSSTPDKTTIYHLCMWDASKNRFINCSGIPNNLIICTNGELPRSNSTYNEAIKNFAYIDIMNRKLYVFDGNSYIEILSSSPTPPTPTMEVYVDDVTLLGEGTQANPFYGAGANISGRSFSGDWGSTTSKIGTVALNRYPGNLEPNVVTSMNSTGIGYGNVECVQDAVPAESENDQGYRYGSNLVGGIQNGKTTGKVSGINGSLIYGMRNSFDVLSGYMSACNVLGYANVVCGTSAASAGAETFRINVIGELNNIFPVNVYGGGNLFVGGRSNSVGVRTYNSQTQTYSYSDGTLCHSNFIYGELNTVKNSTGSQGSGLAIIGSSNSAIDMGSVSIIGDECSANSPQNNSNCEGTLLSGFQVKTRTKLNRTQLIGSTINCATDQYTTDHDNNGYGGRIASTQIIGSDVTVRLTKDDPSAQDYDQMFGVTCIGSSIDINRSIRNSVLVGRSLTCNTNFVTMLGQSLVAPSSQATVIGYNNIPNPTVSTGEAPAIIVGNGSVGADPQPRNAIVIDTSNTMFLYGNTKSQGSFEATGNFTNTEKDISLVSAFTAQTITPSSGVYTLPKLPSNGDELILNASSVTGQVKIASSNVSINGTDVAVSTVEDYCATIVYRLDSTAPITSATDLLVNFTPDSNNPAQYPRIYLVNPDVDITNYTVIHILLFWDGFNLCATVAGYEEDAVS